MPDITGWSIDEIEAWEAAHEQFATEERADAAADAWNEKYLTPEVLAESERWAAYYNAEALLEEDDE